MAADTLSLHVTSDADKASEAIARLAKNMGVLLGVMKSLESGNGLKNLGNNLASASAKIEKALKGANGDYKKAAEGLNEVTKAAEEVKKVTKEIKPKVDTKEVKTAQTEMKKLADNAKEATKKSSEDLHGLAGMAMQHKPTFSAFYKPEEKEAAKKPAERAGMDTKAMAADAAKFRQGWDMSGGAAKRYTETVKEAREETEKIKEATQSVPDWMKNDPNLQAQMERAKRVREGLEETVRDARSLEEKQNDWLFGDATAKQTAHRASEQDRRRERVRANRAAYQQSMAQATGAGEAADTSGVDSAAQSANNASSAFAKLKASASSALSGLTAMASGARGASSSISRMSASSSGSGLSRLGAEVKSIPWRVAIAGSNMFHGAIRKLGHGVKSTGNFIKGFLQGFVGSTFKAAFTAPMRMMKGLLNVGTFGMFGKTAKEGQSAISGLTGALGGGLKGIVKYVLGFRTLFYLVRAIRQGIAEGFTNLASVNAETNASLSMLKSRLTQVKNGLATAFAPVLNAVAPVLNTLIGYIMDAINAVAQFFAALTGQKTWQKAVYKMQDFSGAASDAGSAASDANDKAKELQKTLMSFDKINKLDDADSSSGNGGGGGGGGGGGAAGAGMFTTETISSGASEFAEMVKEAWKKSDFTEVGQTIGLKLKDALDKIPWTDIQAKAEKVGTSLGTLITGFVTTPGLPQTIGTTIGEALNTFLHGINSFVKNVDWVALGSFITTSIQTAFKTFDWQLAGNTFGSLATAVFNLAAGAIQGIDWKSVPGDIVTGIKKFLQGVDWKELFGSIGNLAGSIAGAIRDIIVGGLELMGWDEDADLLENGKNIILGVFNGIKNFVTSAPKWIKDNVLTPFVEKFRDAFSMHSPSQNEDIMSLGSDLIEGVFNGIISWFTGIGDWIKEHIFTPFANKFSEGWESFKKDHPKLTGWFSDLFGGGDDSGNAPSTAKITVDAEETEDYKKIMRDTKDGYLNITDSTATKTAEGKKGSLFGSLLDWWHEITGTQSATKKVNGAKGNLFDAIGTWWNSFNKNKDVSVKVNAKETSKKSGTLKAIADAWSKFKTGETEKSATIKAGANGVSKFTEAIDAWNKFKPKAKDNEKKATLKLETKGNSAGDFRDIYNTMNKGAGSRTLTATVKVSEESKQTLKKWVEFEANPTTRTAVKLYNRLGGAYYGGAWHNIPQYAAGGAPNHGSVFVAGEAGAETVGHINGRTEVLNQSQMAAVMYSAVLRGMSQAMVAYGGSEPPVVVLEGDAKGLFRVVQKEANSYTNATGRPAFNI